MVPSCSNENEQIYTLLNKADSLLNIDPEQSFDLICATETFGKPNNRNLAYKNYLLTYAKYKCFYPLKEEENIFAATEYFRRHGPYNLYGLSLMIQGAVLYEQEKFEESLETYKLAESVIKHYGTNEDMGLINTRIGELYQTSFVNNADAIKKFSNAIRYFELSKNNNRIASSYINYARIIILDSLDISKDFIEKGLAIFQEEKDTLQILSTYELVLYIDCAKGNYNEVIEKVHYLFNNFTSSYISLFKNELLFYLTESYNNIGNIEQSKKALKNISISNAADSILYYKNLIDITKIEENWEDAYKYLQRHYIIYDSLTTAKYNMHLVETERKYELSQIQEMYQRKKAENLTITTLLIILFTSFLIITLIIKYRLKAKIKENELFLKNIELLKEQLKNEQTKQDSYNLSNNEKLQQMLGELMSIIEDIGYTYSINESNPNNIALKVKEKIDEYLSKAQFADVLHKIIENNYPGMLKDIFSINPKLTEDEKWLITLLCSNFTTNTICIMTKLSDSKLKYRKNRLAKKLHSQERISIFLRTMMTKYDKT